MNFSTFSFPKKAIYVLFFILCSSFSAFSQFVTTWSTNNRKIEIPTNSAEYTYNYTVSWVNKTYPGIGDGSKIGQTGNCVINGSTLGEKILETNLSNNQSIDLSQQVKGIYILKLSGNGVNETKKLVKL